MAVQGGSYVVLRQRYSTPHDATAFHTLRVYAPRTGRTQGLRAGSSVVNSSRQMKSSAYDRRISGCESNTKRACVPCWR